MLDTLSLFKQQDTRDELGIGTIRDAFSDLLFPGTSTIQTRARYFLFVPWICKRVERRKVSSHKVPDEVRRLEVKLIRAFRSGKDEKGIIGKQAGRSLKRLPSTIYWGGLGVWRVRLFPGSRSEYFRHLDSFYRAQRRQEDGERAYASRPNWHPGLPDPPDAWLKKAALELREEEGAYLKDRIRSSVPKSLLAFLVGQRGVAVSSEFPWEHSAVGVLPRHLRRQLTHARNFSEVMWGAPLLYNLMLAEQADRDGLRAKHESRLKEWDDILQARQESLQHWAQELTDFWEIASKQTSVAIPAKRFVERWIQLALQNTGQLVESKEARQLIRHREREVKRNRARLDNPRMRELWGGDAGTAQLDYRWGVAQDIIRDILQSLGTKDSHA